MLKLHIIVYKIGSRRIKPLWMSENKKQIKLKSSMCVFIIITKNTIKHINIPLNNIILTGDIGYWNVNCKKTFFFSMFLKASESKLFLCYCILQHRAEWRTNIAHISVSITNFVNTKSKTKTNGWEKNCSVSNPLYFYILFFFLQPRSSLPVAESRV